MSNDNRSNHCRKGRTGSSLPDLGAAGKDLGWLHPNNVFFPPKRAIIITGGYFYPTSDDEVNVVGGIKVEDGVNVVLDFKGVELIVQL